MFSAGAFSLSMCLNLNENTRRHNLKMNLLAVILVVDTHRCNYFNQSHHSSRPALVQIRTDTINPYKSRFELLTFRFRLGFLITNSHLSGILLL